MNRRDVGEAALAVMRNGTGDGFGAQAAPELSRFAARHGLGFIIENETAVEG